VDLEIFQGDRVGADDDRNAIAGLDELLELPNPGTRGVADDEPRGQVDDLAPFLIISSGTYSTFPPGQPPQVE